MPPRRSRSCVRLLALFPALLPACAPAPPPRAAPALSPASAATAREDSALDAALAVQALSLYRQAEAALRGGDRERAAALLARLAADPALSPGARAFCERQRALCLRLAASPKLPPPAPAPVAVAPPRDPDCGPRALALACRALGVEADAGRVRALAGTTKEETTLEGLARAARALGVEAEGVQVSREALDAEVRPPALAWVNRNHYVALLRLEGGGEGATATVRDPNKAGEETMPREQFLSLCGGYLLLLRK